MPPVPVLEAVALPAADETAVSARPVLTIVPPEPQQGEPIEGLGASPAEAPSTGPTARIHWIGRFVDYRHPADLYEQMLAGTPELVVVDARYPESYEREHLPGAISLPWRDLDEAGSAHLSREALYVVYCWDARCHASTKAANRLESLGFKVKELHGGLQAWKKQGYPTERG